MKILFALTFVLSVVLVSNCFAQDAPGYLPLEVEDYTTVPKADIETAEGVHFSWFKLTPDAQSAGVFKLEVHKVDAKLVLQSLVEKAGGKALFDNRFLPQTLKTTSLLGTPAQLIERVAHLSNTTVGHVGKDWVFIPEPAKKIYLPITFKIPAGATVNPMRLDPEFNMNRNPGKNMPPDARSKEFNGYHFYQIPLHPH